MTSTVESSAWQICECMHAAYTRHVMFIGHTPGMQCTATMPAFTTKRFLPDLTGQILSPHLEVKALHEGTIETGGCDKPGSPWVRGHGVETMNTGSNSYPTENPENTWLLKMRILSFNTIPLLFLLPVAIRDWSDWSAFGSSYP